MSTQKETIAFILQILGSEHFTARAMFGEYALYADGKVVALVCVRKRGTLLQEVACSFGKRATT